MSYIEAICKRNILENKESITREEVLWYKDFVIDAKDGKIVYIYDDDIRELLLSDACISMCVKVKNSTTDIAYVSNIDKDTLTIQVQSKDDIQNQKDCSSDSVDVVLYMMCNISF